MMFKHKAQNPMGIKWRFFILLFLCAGERDPIGCWVQRWHRHRLVLSQRRNPLSNEGTRGVGEYNQLESIQTRRFCCS